RHRATGAEIILLGPARSGGHAARGLVEGASGGGRAKNFARPAVSRPVREAAQIIVGPPPADFRAVTKGRPLLRSVRGGLAESSPRPRAPVVLLLRCRVRLCAPR